MCKQIRCRCSAGSRRTILVGTSQAVQMRPNTSVGRSSNVNTCMVNVSRLILISNTHFSTQAEGPASCRDSRFHAFKIGATSLERVAVLPLVVLRLGLPMLHELVRSMASGLIADCRLADAGARLICHKIRAMYGPDHVGKL
jgi:hypothetical protein